MYAYRDGKLLASYEIGGVFRDLGLDHLGSVRVSAEAGFNEINARHTYFPFGREATSTGQNAEPMKFTGHERDLQSTPTFANDDLDYMHARYRSPLTSRFLSTDPVGGSPKAPQSWNRYAYTPGNPLKFTDPDGRSVLHYIRAKWAQAAANAQQSGAAAAGVVADFTPVLGDGKAIYEAYKNPTAVTVIGAAIGLAPGAGDLAAKGLKALARATRGGQRAAISMDRAVELAAEHVGGRGVMEVTYGGNFQFRNSFQNAAGEVETRIGRFDINPVDDHVSRGMGPHLNLEVQINSVSVPGVDPHLPIDPATIRLGDHP